MLDLTVSLYEKDVVFLQNTVHSDATGRVLTLPLFHTLKLKDLSSKPIIRTLPWIFSNIKLGIYSKLGPSLEDFCCNDQILACLPATLISLHSWIFICCNDCYASSNTCCILKHPFNCHLHRHIVTLWSLL